LLPGPVMKRFPTSAGLLGVVGLSLLVVGCSDDPKPGPEWDMETESYSVHLGVVGSCGDVEGALRASAKRRMKLALYEQMMFWLEADEDFCDESDQLLSARSSGDDGGGMEDSPSSGPPTDGGSGPDAVSETNNQVAGVDEADFVKNDDGFIYMLSGASLHVVRSWPADETAEVSSIDIEGEPKKLLVAGDRAIVFSSLPIAEAADPTSAGVYPTYGDGECTYGYECTFTGDGHPTKVTVIDLTDRAAPTVLRELRSNGSLLAARRIGDVVHAVMTMGGPAFPIQPSANIGCRDGDVPDAEDVIESFTRVLLENERIIDAAPIDAILPSLVDSASGNDELATCPSFYRGRLAAGPGFTTLLSFDAIAGGAPSTSTVVSQPGTVYASESSLYMAVPETPDRSYGWYDGFDQASEISVVHKFDLGDAGRSSYVASGAVEGRVLNQFSMDEHDGHLRVATTTGRVPDPDVQSTMTVLGQQGADLVTTGIIRGIAPSEDIRSVRFSGDRGFVVTFKKTDPLFVFDLADPAAPRILSELKIPGFSTYMHMMDDTHVLTIGYDADDHGDFAYFDGVLLQIFDISDPLAPTLAHKEVIGTRGSSSEALTNHLAFNYFAAKNVLAIPMTVCEGGDDGMFGADMTFSGLMVYDVTSSAGFAYRGGLSFPMEGTTDPYGNPATCSNWWTNASSTVQRSVIMDDFVYGITGARIQVSSLDAIDRSIATVELATTTP
jgi:hypothetical protein